MKRQTRAKLLWLVSLVFFLWLIFYIVFSVFLVKVEYVMENRAFLAIKEFLFSEISRNVGLALLGLIILAFIIDRIVEKNQEV